MKNKMLYKVCISGIFATIICVLSFVNFPIGAVPVTLATLGIMIAGVVLSPLEAVMATVTYVLIGLIGIPVFSGVSGGIGVLLGPTGGYIWSYPVFALVISLSNLIRSKTKTLEIVVLFVLCLLGTAFCYFLGVAQYINVCDTNFYTAFVTCVVPFIPIDIIKITAAVFIGKKIKDKII
ncbi:MAG: biotin transporter BioY [Ruminococcaceae bacterium]|nr:biotin transporter BioY [Oscillospiraceae bacterium]